MSEIINNREHRQQVLKELIKKLHNGATVEEVKAEFEALTAGISATEIAEMEQALVNEGMAVEEIQKLCDVHASVFKGSIEEIHKEDGYIIPDFDEGHPVHTFKKENRAIEDLMNDQVLKYLSQYIESKASEHKELLHNAIDKLGTIDKHYTRKENLIFPFMEKYGITAPPQVMWGVDDEIRGKLKAIRELLKQEQPELPKLNSSIREAVNQIHEMIFKEEEIMFPMVLETFALEDWIAIERGSAEIGYTLLSVIKRWMTSVNAPQNEVAQSPISGYKRKDEATSDLTDSADEVQTTSIPVQFDAGSLMPEEINAILNTLPLDMTFVGADNRVKYFTQGKERIFDRQKTIIGREVKNCHPPKSVHVVDQIVKDLRAGVKDHEDFWIKMGEQFVYIRYFAVRNAKGEYLGTLEITQDIKPIQQLEGEKRLMS